LFKAADVLLRDTVSDLTDWITTQRIKFHRQIDRDFIFSSPCPSIS